MTRNWVALIFFSLFLAFLSSCGSPTEPIDGSSPAADGSSLSATSSGRYAVRVQRIPSFDGVELMSRLYEPNPSFFPGPRPSIIFANSWVLDEREYEVQARAFAYRGYLVLSYATRGFGRSGGRVTVAGPDDLKDISSLIDWLLTNTDADVRNMAMAGVSYGGGLALLGAAGEPRIKTAVAMSAWADLEQALYGQDTVREVWLNLLLSSGVLAGRLDSSIFEQVRRLRENREIDQVRAWARDRSVSSWIERLNQRQVPIFVANSYQDQLFPPSQMRPFFEQLTGPKRFYLDPGIHASSALPGLVGLPSVIWSEVHRWMDHWLRDIDKGLGNAAPISFQTNLGREDYASFPKLLSKTADLRLRVLNTAEPPPESGLAPDDQEAQIVITGGADSGATSGIPLVSDTGAGVFDKPVLKKISRIDRNRALVLLSDRLRNDSRLRGSPRVQVRLNAHSTPLQLVVYLYEVNRWGVGTLITHGVYSRREAQGEASTVTLDLALAAYELKSGHRLALVVDTRDPLYEQASAGPYTLSFPHGRIPAASLDLPLLP